MEYYIVYKPNQEENYFMECDSEYEMIDNIMGRKDSDLGNYKVFLNII
tara:strand:- start:629 stop:772 length:144 start_codon:yes stop_codon:yes gene_type:complete